MARYLLILGALLATTFLFEQSEGKVTQGKEDVALLGNRKLKIADNLSLKGFIHRCEVEADIWRCCVGFEGGLNVTACSTIEYLEDEYGLEMNVTLDSFLLFNEKVSARNPPPICFPVPYLEKIADACFRIHDLDIKDKHLTGCVDLEGDLEIIKIFHFKLGCFDWNFSFLGNKNKYNVNFKKNNSIL